MTKLDFSKPDRLQTRDGRQVRIYATDGCGTYCVHGAIQTSLGWQHARWDEEGSMYSNIRNESDIVHKPARVTGWVSVFPGFIGSTVHETKEQAESIAVNSIGQIYIDSEIVQS